MKLEYCKMLILCQISFGYLVVHNTLEKHINQMKMEAIIKSCLVNPFEAYILNKPFVCNSVIDNYIIPNSYDDEHKLVILQNRQINLDAFYSSVWCSTSITSGLRCKFHNVCYFPSKAQVIFILSPSSILYGIESISELSANLFSSSVTSHNAFVVQFAVVNASNILKYRIRYKFIFINETSLLFSRFKPDNLEHIFHDDLLPLYFSLKELSGGISDIKNIISFVIDGYGKLKYDYLYKAVAKNLVYMVDFQENDWICFSEAYIGLNKLSLWHSYNFNEENDTKPKLTINSNHIFNFVDSFVSTLNVPFGNLKGNLGMKVIILIRESTRKLLNLDDVEEAVFTYFNHDNYPQPIIKRMSLEVDGIETIITELVLTNLLIGMHGAALILALFMPQDSCLLELWPFGVKESIEPVYKTLCDIKGISYRFWINEDIKNTVIHPEYPVFYGGIPNWDHDNNHYNNLIKSLEKSVLEKIRYCDDPEWLFRIYQDTVVNVYPNQNLQSRLFQDILATIPFHSNHSFDMHPIISDHEYLSQVENVSCDIFIENDLTKVIVNWSLPWNSEEFSCAKATFEVTLKEISEITDKSTLIYWVVVPPFLKKFSYIVNEVHIWITPFCNEIKGAVLFINCYKNI